MGPPPFSQLFLRAAAAAPPRRFSATFCSGLGQHALLYTLPLTLRYRIQSTLRAAQRALLLLSHCPVPPIITSLPPATTSNNSCLTRPHPDQGANQGAGPLVGATGAATACAKGSVFRTSEGLAGAGRPAAAGCGAAAVMGIQWMRTTGYEVRARPCVSAVCSSSSVDGAHCTGDGAGSVSGCKAIGTVKTHSCRDSQDA